MKFTCTRENLAKALQLTSGITTKPGNLPILSNVLLKVSESGVEVITTNLELAITSHLRAKVDTAGEYTVPAKILNDYVNLLSDEQVTVSREENELLVECGSSSTKIKGIEADEYPVIPTMSEGNVYGFETGVLKEALAQVVFAAAKNDIRPELAGVYCGFNAKDAGKLTIAATDSYRLAERSLAIKEGQENQEVIIPARAIIEFIRLLSVQGGTEDIVHIKLTGNQVGIQLDGGEIISRLVDGTYPDYRQIIPENFATEIVFDKDVAQKNIKAASLFTTTGINAVHFNVDSKVKQLIMTSTNTQAGAHASSVDVEITGDDNEILLNHKYVLDGLGKIDTSDIMLGVNSKDSPCVFSGREKNDYKYIVMPIRQ
ncbi:MAG: DNA polymerase III subunit beta [Candidatus Magasanikbacteria bacterium]|jgi:DNA polymerase III subunit beta|nr:DNA polymerase III subunit beta [Candidatus Magasanikbacteria bacterium]